VELVCKAHSTAFSARIVVVSNGCEKPDPTGRWNAGKDKEG